MRDIMDAKALREVEQEEKMWRSNNRKVLAKKAQLAKQQIKQQVQLQKAKRKVKKKAKQTKEYARKKARIKKYRNKKYLQVDMDIVIMIECTNNLPEIEALSKSQGISARKIRAVLWANFPDESTRNTLRTITVAGDLFAMWKVVEP